MAGEEGSAPGNIEFDGSNYAYWRMQMEDYLFSKKLHLTLGSKPEGMKVDKWNLLDMQVLGVIRLKLLKNMAYNIVKEKMTMGMMQALIDMYEKPCLTVVQWLSTLIASILW